MPKARTWRKLGHVFVATGERTWMTSHASNPTAELLAADTVRVYFSARDPEQRSSIGFVDVALGDAPRVLQLGSEPIASPGPPGHFDESGLSIGAFVREPTGAARIYYLGWNLGQLSPWRNSIGALVRAPGSEAFVRFSPGPLLDRSVSNPYSLSYPWVLHDGSRWRMWYGSNLTTGPDREDITHTIKYAESDDGFDWRLADALCLPLDLQGDETSITRPSVIADGATWRMWYSIFHRDRHYSIGYAESGDGRSWQRRDDEAGIGLSASGWDSEMLCYPCVFESAGRLYMLYCGNGYGRTGFGLAVADD